jgi:ectoine hydroxylase-related dioxygenase (phytanoyl-CoA dioxygenase family)
MKNIDVTDLNKKGFVHLKNLLEAGQLSKLTEALDRSFTAHRDIQIKNNVEITTMGVALHVILNESVFIDFLRTLSETGIYSALKEHYFHSNFILNSFGGNNNLPHAPHYATNIHRDIRFFSGELNIMLNMIVMLDDFSIENGATFLLPYSHKDPELPGSDIFYKDAAQMVGKAGDIVLFNSNLWHAGGINKTDGHRRALTLTFSKPFMKQQLDYCKAIGFEKVGMLDEDTRQLLGYNSRVPSSLDEWYQPLEKRFYKKNQD